IELMYTIHKMISETTKSNILEINVKRICTICYIYFFLFNDDFVFSILNMYTLGGYDNMVSTVGTVDVNDVFIIKVFVIILTIHTCEFSVCKFIKFIITRFIFVIIFIIIQNHIVGIFGINHYIFRNI